MGKVVKAALVGALIATGIGLAAGAMGIAGGITWSAASSYFIRQFAINAVLGFISGALNKSSASTANDLRGQSVMRRDPIMSRKIAYGRVKTSGAVVFMEATGTDNKYLHTCVTLAGHEISAVKEVYLADRVAKTNLADSVEVTGDALAAPDYGTATKMTAHFGGVDQLADTNLVSRTSATVNHRLRNIAYIYTQMTYNRDVFATGQPNISAVIEGKKVYDPRTGSTAYSNNAALCLLDYIMDDRYGLGADLTEVNTSSFITAANICDENVSLDAGGAEKRYTLNGLIDTAASPSTILSEMASAMAGTVFYSNGKWHCKAGAYITPTDTLTEDDFVGQVSVTTRVTNQSNFNAVKGVFLSPDDNWQPVDYPAITSSVFENEDGGERRYADIPFALTTSAARAQRLAKIALYRNREQITVSVPCKLSAFKYEIGDTLMLTYSRFGWSSKVFEVIGWNMSISDEGIPAVVLNLKETSPTVYQWSVADEGALTRNNTTLPDPFTVTAPTSLQISQLGSVLADGAFQSDIIVTWGAAAIESTSYFEVQWKRGAASNDYGLIINAATINLDYDSITAGATSTLDHGLITEALVETEQYFNSIFTSDQQYVINNTLDGVDYTVRVRAVNSFGIKSAWVSSTITPLADTTPPQAPDSVFAVGGFRQVELRWSNPPDEDFDITNIYRNSTNNYAGATYVGSTRSTRFVDAGLGINETWYYWLTAADRTGNVSDETASVSATTAFVSSADFSAEVMNLFSEAGAYGIEPVSSLPATGDFDGQIKYDTTSNKLYRWDEVGGAWSDDIFSITSGSVDLASFAAGIEPVSVVASLPNPTGYTGAKVVFLTTDNKLYRYDSSVPRWTSATAATDISGTIGEVNFPSNLRPIEIVNSLPVADLFDGRQVYLTTDKKLYRYNGTGWVKTIASSDISGTLSDSQLSAIAASKITGSITGTQITNGAISTAKLAAGAVTSNEIAANTITSNEIAANTITGTEIAAATISGDNLVANTITSGQIAAAAITADEIATDAITSDKIAANAITAGKLAAGAITTDSLAAGLITSDKIAAGTIQASNIAANTITGGLIAASGIITSAAQIENSVIDNIVAKNVSVGVGGSGARLEITNDVIRVYDSSGVLRVKLGDLS